MGRPTDGDDPTDPAGHPDLSGVAGEMRAEWRAEQEAAAADAAAQWRHGRTVADWLCERMHAGDRIAVTVATQSFVGLGDEVGADLLLERGRAAQVGAHAHGDEHLGLDGALGTLHVGRLLGLLGIGIDEERVVLGKEREHLRRAPQDPHRLAAPFDDEALPAGNRRNIDLDAGQRQRRLAVGACGAVRRGRGAAAGAVQGGGAGRRRDCHLGTTAAAEKQSHRASARQGGHSTGMGL